MLGLALTLLLLFGQGFGDCPAQACDNDNQCSFPGCTYCDPTTFFCSAGKKCAESCVVDRDCDASTGCWRCVSGSCRSSGNCQSFCQKDGDCVPNFGCNQCLDNKCQPGCNSPCVNSSTCVYAPTCPYCMRHSCSRGGCQASCSSDADCRLGGGGICNWCFLPGGWCLSICGAPCTESSQCPQNFNCSTCYNGICQRGSCGDNCIDNSGCRPTTCSKCVSRKCTQGGACNAQCVVNTDCDQTGSCHICSVHGYCVLGEEDNHVTKKISEDHR